MMCVIQTTKKLKLKDDGSSTVHVYRIASRQVWLVHFKSRAHTRVGLASTGRRTFQTFKTPRLVWLADQLSNQPQRVPLNKSCVPISSRCIFPKMFITYKSVDESILRGTLHFLVILLRDHFRKKKKIR